MAVRRVFVEKRDGFNGEARSLCADLRGQLGLDSLESVRILARYDADGLDENQWREAVRTVFSEPMVDAVYDSLPEGFGRPLVREYLPGQYDQRADSAAQCIQLLTGAALPAVRAAAVFGFNGKLTEAQFAAIRAYLINPVECREGSLAIPDSLSLTTEQPAYPEVLDGFTSHTRESMAAFHKDLGLAMSIEDALFVAEYFQSEGREPTITELRIIDTYWSDHCRHTTFGTHLDEITIDPAAGCIREAFARYLSGRRSVYGQNEGTRPVCLMDVATLGGKWLAKSGMIPDLDVSEEINACSIRVEANINGVQEPWLVMFKNETHNHPTEIEPFGGAATCLGGAIRDPLSGRSYVYQSMRVTGSADPRVPLHETRPGKLPQRVITRSAAAGFASYGNQIGLATGQVAELYHPGWEAKRMEIGAVVAAAPAANVVRRAPKPGDVIVLLGGRTGRDGCGGATGSSKAHTAQSLDTCGAEVQKGNPITERKIQRLFRDPSLSRLIARCNDFGAGGVCVAVGELADSLDICLDAVPLKYEGLSCTELAISESQERMAVVLDAADVPLFLERAAQENLEAAVVARVTDSGRLRMSWKDKTVADLSRDFLNTNGVAAHARASIPAPRGDLFSLPDDGQRSGSETIGRRLLKRLAGLHGASRRGLVERFDASIGGATVLMPFAGKFQATPVQVMAAKLPVPQGETTTATLMAYAFDPRLAEKSPFHGAAHAVCESVLKIACAGGEAGRVRLTFQEYFPRLGNDPERWGMPLAALLGAFSAQMRLHIPAIGGKDSMSGSFENLDVPPALVSFALAPADARVIISGEFKKEGSTLVLAFAPTAADGLIDYEVLLKLCDTITGGIRAGHIRAAYSCEDRGILQTAAYMAFGNGIGASLTLGQNEDALRHTPATVLIELAEGAQASELFASVPHRIIGVTGGDSLILNGERLSLSDLFASYEGGLESVFPTKAASEKNDVTEAPLHTERSKVTPRIRVAKPRVLIPVFPGTNCEYDTARAFERSGAETRILIVRNTRPNDIEETVQALQEAIANAQILALPGGFSGGDEPDGSGKFIATVLRSARLADEVTRLLEERDGLMIGICNGFQALIKLGLVPYGQIKPMQEGAPTLTFNAIGRHQSRIVRTKTVSVLSPWFAGLSAGDIISVPVSHGEGRFVCSHAEYAKLSANGQIATQYVDENGMPAWKTADNPAGSYQAVEGITSPDGRVLGKMGHNERYTPFTFKNVPGNYNSRIFESGVRYFL